MKRFILFNILTMAVGAAILLNVDTVTAQFPLKDKKTFIPIKAIQTLHNHKKDLAKDKKDPTKDKKDGTKNGKKDGKKDGTDDGTNGTNGPNGNSKGAQILNTVKDIIGAFRGNGQGDVGGGGGGSGGDFGGGGGGIPPMDPAPVDTPPAPAPVDTPQPDDAPRPDNDVKADKGKSKTMDVTDDTPKETPPAKDDTAKPGEDATKPQGDTESKDEGERDQVFTRRFVKVKNDTDKTIMVYIQYRGQDDKKWTWIPSNPSEANDALVFELKPGQERFLVRNNERISASRMRLWGIANDQSWLEYRDRDLWAVPEANRGEHRYLAVEMQTFTHVFSATK